MPIQSSDATAHRARSFEHYATATGYLCGTALVLFEGIGRDGAIAPLSLAAVVLLGAALSLQLRPGRPLPARSLALVFTALALALTLTECARHATAAGAVLLLTAGSLLARLRQTPPHSQSRLAEIAMQHANDAMFLFDEQMRIVETNHRATTLYGYTREELLTLRAPDLRSPEKQPTTTTDFTSAHNPAGFLFETIHRRKDRAPFPVEVSARPLEIEGRRFILSVVRDVTERITQQEEIERLNRMYLVISEVNQTIVRARTREEMLTGICQVLIDYGRFKIAWVGWLNPTTLLLEPQAIAGDDLGYLSGLRISTDVSVPEGRGPSGQAFRSGTTYVCNDFFNDPSTVPWRERATRSGFHSSIALPLVQEGKRVGLLTVYAAERNFFVPRKIALLEEAAGDISFCLDVFVAEERRLQAVAALKASEGRLSFLLSATPAVIYSLRADGDFATTFISENVQHVLGYPPRDFTTDAGFWLRHVHPDDARDLGGEFGKFPQERAGRREYRFLHADGTYRWMHDHLRTIEGADRQPREFVGYWLDITNRKEAEAALRTREEIFSSIVSQAPDAIVLVDSSSGRFAEFNKAAHEGLGYTREEFSALTISDIQADHPSSTIRDNIRRIIDGGALTFETRHRHRSGAVRDVEVSARAITVLKHDYVTAVWSDITGRKLAENKLRKLSRAIEQAPLSVAITDLSGAIEYVNPHFSKVTGYTLEEVVGQNPRVLKSGETPGAVYTDMWQTLSAGRVWHGELRNRKKNGALYVETAVIAPIVDELGHPTHYVALKEDITERKRTEAALHETQERYRLIAENTGDVIWLYDLAGEGFAFVSPSVIRILGFNSEEMLGKKMPEILVPASVAYTSEALVQRLARLAAGDETARIAIDEVEQYRKDGSIVPSEVMTALLTDGRGHPTQILGVSRDITERRRTAAALQHFNSELEQKVTQRTAELATRNREIQALLDAIPDLVMRFRADGTVINYHAALNSTRLATFATTATTPGALSPQLTAPALEAGLRALASATVVVQEVALDGPAGSIAVELRVAPLGDDQFVAFVRDISARKRLETETAAMLERERQVSEMKTRFISVTSHEFRTPMAAVMGSVELIRNHFDRLTPAKREEIFERIRQAMHRLTEMLDDVLTLSRMDSGRLGLQLTTVNLRLLTQSIVEESQIADRGAHRYEVVIVGEDYTFQTDPGHLHHILSNLLSNAARYSPENTLITTRLQLEPHRIVLSVTDEGIGIPAEDRRRIFQPFERASNIGTVKGTGLGLNIVQRMTELLGGTISLEPAPVRGSRFTVELPRPTAPTP